jgi:hypothetical protein
MTLTPILSEQSIGSTQERLRFRPQRNGATQVIYSHWKIVNGQLSETPIALLYLSDGPTVDQSRYCGGPSWADNVTHKI